MCTQHKTTQRTPNAQEKVRIGTCTHTEQHVHPTQDHPTHPKRTRKGAHRNMHAHRTTCTPHTRPPNAPKERIHIRSTAQYNGLFPITNRMRLGLGGGRSGLCCGRTAILRQRRRRVQPPAQGPVWGREWEAEELKARPGMAECQGVT